MDVRARLAAYFKDDPDDERDPTESLWLEGDSLAPYIVTPLVNCIRALECAAFHLAAPNKLRQPLKGLSAGCHERTGDRTALCSVAPFLCRQRAAQLSSFLHRMAGVQAGDCVADIGCGDGRVVVRILPR